MVRASSHICSDRGAISPYTGHWGGIPFDHDLYDKFGPKALDKCARNSQGSWKEWNYWYKNDRKKEGGRGETTPSDRQTSYDRESQAATSVHGHTEPAIAVANEPPSDWLCDQGCCKVGDEEANDAPAPVNRSRFPCRDAKNLIKMIATQQELEADRRELTPSEADMMPLEEEEHDRNGVHAARSPTPGENVNGREELPAAPIATSTPSVMVCNPPPNRSSPLIRPVRHPPTFGCALPPPANDLDPSRELQSFIGTRSATMDALRHRQTLARDLRLGPQLYSWMVFGVMPGDAPPPFPLPECSIDNSDDQNPGMG